MPCVTRAARAARGLHGCRASAAQIGACPASAIGVTQALVERLARVGADPSTIRKRPDAGSRDPPARPQRWRRRRGLVAGVELPAGRGKRKRYATAEEAARLAPAVS
jgi:hypothetical protein